VLNINEVPNAARVKEVQQRILNSHTVYGTNPDGTKWQTKPSDLDIYTALHESDQEVNAEFYAETANQI